MMKNRNRQRCPAGCYAFLNDNGLNRRRGSNLVITAMDFYMVRDHTPVADAPGYHGADTMTVTMTADYSAAGAAGAADVSGVSSVVRSAI